MRGGFLFAQSLQHLLPGNDAALHFRNCSSKNVGSASLILEELCRETTYPRMPKNVPSHSDHMTRGASVSPNNRSLSGVFSFKLLHN